MAGDFGKMEEWVGCQDLCYFNGQKKQSCVSLLLFITGRELVKNAPSDCLCASRAEVAHCDPS